MERSADASNQLVSDEEILRTIFFFPGDECSALSMRKVLDLIAMRLVNFES